VRIFLVIALPFIPSDSYASEDPVVAIVIAGLSLFFQVGMLIILICSLPRGRALLGACLIYSFALFVWWAYSLQLADLPQKLLGLLDFGCTLLAFFGARYAGRRLHANGG
jgi:hypothetical protein